MLLHNIWTHELHLAQHTLKCGQIPLIAQDGIRNLHQGMHKALSQDFRQNYRLQVEDIVDLFRAILNACNFQIGPGVVLADSSS